MRAQSVYVLYDADEDTQSVDALPAEGDAPAEKGINAVDDFQSLVDKRKSMARTREEDEVASANHPSPVPDKVLSTSPSTTSVNCYDVPKSPLTEPSASDSSLLDELPMANGDVFMDNAALEIPEVEESRRVSSKAKGKRKAS